MGPGSVTVSVPASSANLGPGFDSFGLALEMRNRFTARLADEWTVHVRGEGSGEFPEDEGNPVARAMRAVFAEAGRTDLVAAIECDNSIPPGSGLGSSAAAIVGGMLLADRLCEARLGPDRLLELAAAMEGHPDNVAAALLGGYTIAWTTKDDRARAVRVEPGGGLAAVIVMSTRPLATAAARDMLPETVPHAAAAFNAARAGLLAVGITLGEGSLIGAGSADRIHESHRRSAVPDLEAIRSALLEAGAAGVVLSGAGPTVIGLVSAENDRAALTRATEVSRACAPDIETLESRCPPRVIAVARSGGSVIER